MDTRIALVPRFTGGFHKFQKNCVRVRPLRYPFVNIHSLLLTLVSKICVHLYDSFLRRHDLRGAEEEQMSE